MGLCRRILLVALLLVGSGPLLLAQKKMNTQGRMRLEHVNETVMGTLEITGFAEIFYIADSELVS